MLIFDTTVENAVVPTVRLVKVALAGRDGFVTEFGRLAVEMVPVSWDAGMVQPLKVFPDIVAGNAALFTVLVALMVQLFRVLLLMVAGRAPFAMVLDASIVQSERVA